MKFESIPFNIPIFPEPKSPLFRCHFMRCNQRIDLGRSPSKHELARKYVQFWKDEFNKAQKTLNQRSN